jgi:hypothetical protein
MEDDYKPCCAADALRRIRQVKINGVMTGITMLDECIAEVRKLKLTDQREIREALMKQVKVYNYVPKSVEEEYAKVLFEKYKKSSPKNETNEE